MGNRLPRSLLPPPPLGTRMSHWGRWNRDTGSADPRASPSRHTSARALRHLRRRSACCTSILATGGSATCSSPRIPATARSAEDRTLATVSSAGADALVFLSWCPASFWPSRCSWTCGTRLCPAQSRGSARQRAARRTREALPARESSCSFQDRKPGLRVPARARLRSCAFLRQPHTRPERIEHTQADALARTVSMPRYCRSGCHHRRLSHAP